MELSASTPHAVEDEKKGGAENLQDLRICVVHMSSQCGIIGRPPDASGMDDSIASELLMHSFQFEDLFDLRSYLRTRD